MFFQHSIGPSKICEAEHHCNAKTHQSRITLFILILSFCCSITSNAIACPYCGFVIKTNAVVSSVLYAVIIFLFGIFLIKLFPELSRLSNVRTIFVVLLFSLLVGVLFYRWPNLRPFDVLPYERMRQLSRPLDDVCVYILVIIITLPALWLRVVRNEGWLYRFILGLVGFAIPVFWLVTLLRYMIVSPTYPDVLARNMLLIWLIIAILSTVPHLFSLVCAILAGCIFLAFFISGAFDTASFIFISAILVAILTAIFVLFIKKTSSKSDRLDPKNDSGPMKTRDSHLFLAGCKRFQNN